MEVQWPDESIFSNFTVFEETYKTVNSHGIKAAILIPKNATSGLRPAIVNIHGGFLTYGHCLFAPFFTPWILKLALEEQAIIISADYRLLPSKNGVADILEDLEDFWKWTKLSLPSILGQRAPDLALDFKRLLLTGGSAGGYCAMQIALSHPDEITAMAMAYPFVDPADEVILHGPRAEDPTILHLPFEGLPSKDDVLAWISESRKTVISQAGMERTLFSVAATQYGLLYTHIFDSAGLERPEFLPLERIRTGARLPRNIWILTGEEDSVVYLRTIQKCADLVAQKLPDTAIRLDVAKGEDHAFDLLKATWELHAIGALDYVKKSWLGR